MEKGERAGQGRAMGGGIGGVMGKYIKIIAVSIFIILLAIALLGYKFYIPPDECEELIFYNLKLVGCETPTTYNGIKGNSTFLGIYLPTMYVEYKIFATEEELTKFNETLEAQLHDLKTTMKAVGEK